VSVESFLEKFTTSDGDWFSNHMSKWDRVITAIGAIGDCVKQGECWVYPHTDADGYSRIRVESKNTTASRLVLCCATNKPLDYGMDACHRTPLCRFRACINPEHLFWDTHAENCKRRELERRARKTISEVAGRLVGA
jgi:hypothetical protein